MTGDFVTAHRSKKSHWMAVRFRVYQYVRKVMEQEHRCPTGAEVSKEFKIHPETACAYLSNLSGADGLPMRVTSGKDRMGGIFRFSEHAHQAATEASLAVRGAHFDENELAVDQIFAIMDRR